jgi:DNA-binding response OmpR family regulator
MKQALKILFADDDLKYSLVILRFLKKEGYEVTYTAGGLAALEQFAAVKPDLVLLDINMPDMDGFEVAARIREKDRRTLVFFLTDRSDKPDRLKGFDLQGNDYIAKPFYPEELIARIRERFGATADAQTHTFGETAFNYSANELRTGNSKTLITSRQADILRLLAAHLNTAVSRETILTTVWGDASYANSLALNVQITYLRKALRNDATVAITSLSKKGYALTVTVG